METINQEHKNINNVRLWQLSTAVLVILFIGSIFIDKSSLFSTSITGNAVAEQTIEYLNKNILQGQAAATVTKITESNGLYNIKLNINGKEIDSYATKDGKLLFPQAIDLTAAPETSSTPTPVDVPKSNKPTIELFVMSHCPYGTQIEKGLIPVVKTLGNKIDFKVKFVNYAMHGKKELDEQLLQYCIQKEHKHKYLSYLGAFLEEGNTQQALTAVGLSIKDLSSCISETDKQYQVTALFEDPLKNGWSGNFPPFKVYDTENKKYGIQGSPTLIINGQQVETNIDADSLLNTICNAFDTKPTECNMDLATVGNPSPGFGFANQGGSATTAGCGT